MVNRKKSFFNSNCIKMVLVPALILLFVSCSTTIKGDWYKASGDELECYLAGNATTGYQWSCDVSNPQILFCEDSDYEVDKSKPGMVGVGGRWEFEFDCMGTGDCTLTFNYARSWEDSPIETKTLLVSCKNGKIKSVIEQK